MSRQKKFFLSFLGVVGGLSLVSYAEAYSCGYEYGGSMMGGGFYGFPWMSILWGVILLVAVLAVFFWAQKGVQKNEGSASHTALDILKERFAKGEIDEKEFEDKKRALEK